MCPITSCGSQAPLWAAQATWSPLKSSTPSGDVLDEGQGGGECASPMPREYKLARESRPLGLQDPAGQPMPTLPQPGEPDPTAYLGSAIWAALLSPNETVKFFFKNFGKDVSPFSMWIRKDYFLNQRTIFRGKQLPHQWPVHALCTHEHWPPEGKLITPRQGECRALLQPTSHPQVVGEPPESKEIKAGS